MRSVKRFRRRLAALMTVTMAAGMLTVPSFAAVSSKTENASDAQEPEYKTVKMYDSKKNEVQTPVFYANGTAIVIEESRESGKGAKITWEGGSKEVEPEAQIYAGGGLGTDFSGGSIVMKSGKVDSIWGGGYGVKEDGTGFDKTQSADTGSVYLEMQGGTVRQIVGGGQGYSKTDDVEINMLGGKSGAVMGGGCSSVTKIGDTSTAADAVNSPCRVNSVKINLTGAEVSNYPGYGGMGAVYGGGQGYSYTGDVEINVSDKMDLSNSYLIGAGSNGHTDSAKINVMSGTVDILQAVNRGTLEKAEIRVLGGTVKNLYAAGETKDMSVNGVVSRTRVTITKGTVENLQPGSNGTAGTNLPADSEVCSVRIGKGAEIQNLAEAKELFGSSLEILLTELTLNKTNLELAIGETELLKAELTGGSASGSEMKEILWESSDEKIVLVSADGTVTAEKAGTAVVTAVLAEDDAITASCTVSVKKPTIKITPSKATVKVGNELELEAEASPSEAEIEWSIEDESVLEDVTEFDEDNGVFVVRGRSVGETKVTARLSDDEDIFAVCSVTVKENKNLPLEEQVDAIAAGLDGALRGGPSGDGEELSAKEKTLVVEQTLNSTATTVTSAAVSRLEEPGVVYDSIADLEEVIAEHLAVESGVEDGDTAVNILDVRGLIANLDVEQAGGVLPAAGEEKSLKVILQVEDTDLPEELNENVEADSAAAIDISLLQGTEDGDLTKIQPRIPVLITIDAPENIDLEKKVGVWTIHNGTKRTVKSWVDPDFEEITFLGNQFSVFVIGNVKEKADTKPAERAGRSSGGKSSGWHPQGYWSQDQTGWRYRTYEGSYAAGCWMQISYNERSDWYHFNQSGYMDTGWFTDVDGLIYYLNPVSDGYRGSMMTGWQVIEGKEYYFNPVSDGSRGSMYVNRVTPDGAFVGADGAKILR